MFLEVLVYVLTPLAAVVVVLTRLRLSGGGSAAGRLQISHRLLSLHTIFGGLALIVWVLFLAFPTDSLLGGAGAGIVAIGLWWVTTILGLLVLARWLPARGKHAEPAATDSWSKGPWLSMLAHIGLLVGVPAEGHRKLADSLDQFEGFHALLLANHVTQDAAQQADVLHQGTLVVLGSPRGRFRVGRHG